jgi:hypothetical protein
VKNAANGLDHNMHKSKQLTDQEGFTQVVRKKNQFLQATSRRNNEHHEPTKRLVKKDGQSILLQAPCVTSIAHNAPKEHANA